MKYLALDFETGGLDPQRHGVCSLGVVMFEDGEPVLSREWLVKPPRNKNGRRTLEYHANALEVNGHTMAELEEKGMPEADVLYELDMWIQNHGLFLAQIVSHNTVFDAAFLSQMIFRSGTWDNRTKTFVGRPEPLGGAWVCTRRMMRKLELPDSKLDTLIAHFGMARKGEIHGALEDAELAGRAYWMLRQAYSAKAGAA